MIKDVFESVAPAETANNRDRRRADDILRDLRGSLNVVALVDFCSSGESRLTDS